MTRPGGNSIDLQHVLILGFCAVCVQFWVTSSASASCGDWLEHPAQAQDVAEGTNQNQHETPVSCQGPECRGPTESPLPDAPKRPSQNDDDQRGNAAIRNCLGPLPLTSLSVEEGLILSEGLLPRVDRPPRA